MQSTSTSVALTLLALLSGCDSEKRSPAASKVKPTDAAAAASTSARAAAAAAPTLVDLLHRTEVLVLSSSHKDELSQAGFLVDQLLESAWRPNPPDSRPWLELQFAHDVELRRLSLQAAGEPGPELEIRIAPDRLLRRQGTLYELTLAEPLRTKTLRLSIVSQAQPRAGKAAELAFSELRVEGSLSAEHELPEAIPEARVHRNGPPFRSSEPAFRAWWKAAPYASAEALCAAHEQAFRPRPDALEDGELGCYVAEDKLLVEGMAPQGVRSVRLVNVGLPQPASLLVVESASGWSPANLWSESDAFDGTCPGMHEMRARVVRSFWEGSVLVQERYRHYFPPSGIYAQAGGPPAVAVRSVLRCEVSSSLACLEHVLAWGAPSVTSDELGEVTTQVPKTWTWERSYAVGSTGWLRFSPCQASSPAQLVVPCLAPGQSELP